MSIFITTCLITVGAIIGYILKPWIDYIIKTCKEDAKRSYWNLQLPSLPNTIRFNYKLNIHGDIIR